LLLDDAEGINPNVVDPEMARHFNGFLNRLSQILKFNSIGYEAVKRRCGQKKVLSTCAPAI
jgi:hypothetical protein